MTTAFNTDGSNLQKPALGKALFGDSKEVAFGAGPASASDAKMAKQVAETFTMRRNDGLTPAGLGGF
ncbi:MAG: hypothetical protein K2X66_07335, partial [Cyanobacteria bacterium]|nr:hypothetical protein [Cyanobacteriota bacterium]